MLNDKAKNLIVSSLKILAIGVCLTFIIDQYLFTIDPFSISPAFILSFLALIALKWHARKHSPKGDFKPSHIPLIAIPLFLAVHFRAGIYWVSNTFPVKDAYAVWLNLQNSFDDFTYSMVRQYLITTIPQAIAITVILTVFLYVLLSTSKKRLIGAGIYIAAAIVFFFIDVPIFDYVHLIKNEPEKNASYATFFIENYISPDSVKITPPEQKRNLILIYLESLETTFSDKEHGGNQNTNLIPEITELAQQNVNFGRNKKHIGGGLDAVGSNHTYGAMHARTLGIPYLVNSKKVPILHEFKGIYKILNDYGYRQVFFQGNSGYYGDFRDFAIEQKIDESYGPNELIQQLNLDTAVLIRKQGFKTVQDKEVFKFARQILDTLPEPFSLTFFTMDTHTPYGLYDPDCVKAANETKKEERLKASIQCVSRELKNFLDSIKTKSFYENTSIVIFGDHLFMGTCLVNDFPSRKWVDIFINSSKTPVLGENRLFSDIDMFPTILSSLNFVIEGDRMGLGTDLFSNKKTFLESIGLDSLNKEMKKIPSYLLYDSYLRLKKNNP